MIKIEELNIYNQTSMPYFGIVIIILTIIPLIVIYFLTSKKYNIKAKKVKILNVIKYITLIILFVMMLLHASYDLANANVILGFVLGFYILYYELFIRYLVRGHAIYNLYEPFIYVKVPIQISLALALIFSSIWGNSMPSIILSIIFAILHVYTAYITYLDVIKEVSPQLLQGGKDGNK